MTSTLVIHRALCQLRIHEAELLIESYGYLYLLGQRLYSYNAPP